MALNRKLIDKANSELQKLASPVKAGNQRKKQKLLANAGKIKNPFAKALGK